MCASTICKIVWSTKFTCEMSRKTSNQIENMCPGWVTFGMTGCCLKNSVLVTVCGYQCVTSVVGHRRGGCREEIGRARWEETNGEAQLSWIKNSPRALNFTRNITTKQVWQETHKNTSALDANSRLPREAHLFSNISKTNWNWWVGGEDSMLRFLEVNPIPKPRGSKGCQFQTP